MKLLNFPSAAALDEAAGRWLARDARGNNLILSRLRSAVRSGDGAQGWLVTRAGVPQLALLAHASVDLVLSEGTGEAATWAARNLETVPGVTGPAAVADPFAAGWRERTGCAASV